MVSRRAVHVFGVSDRLRELGAFSRNLATSNIGKLLDLLTGAGLRVGV